MDLTLDILTTGALLFIVTSGLMMVFGVMQIVNFAHGSIIAVGGYTAFLIAKSGIGAGWGWLIAFAVGAALGAVVERLIVRPLYRRPLDAILATWGLGIVIIQLITMYFGRGVQFVDSPLQGAWSIGGAQYSAYRLVMLPVALALCGLLTLLLSGTRFGVKTRAVIMNERLAESMGINCERIRFITFSIGGGLGALAGLLVTPLSSVDPYMGMPWLTAAFMLVMVSGHSFVSLLLTCLVLGGCQVLVSIWINPVLGGLAIAVLAAVTLRLRPKGFANE